jgi:hypothetical protein
MALVQHNPPLNQLLIDIGRSLMQYVGQCSSWSGRSQAASETAFAKLVARQKNDVEQLAKLLIDRRWPIDFGVFSSSFTDLHFLSLKYLAKHTLVNQTKIVAELEEAAHICVDDPEAANLIKEVLASERKITEELQSIS